MLLKRHHILGLLVFLVMMLFTAFFVNMVYQLRLDKEMSSLENTVNNATNRINDRLAESQDVIITLKYLISKYGFPESLDDIGKELIKPNSVVSTIEYVIDSTIRCAYPVKGNEAIIGYNILKDSNRNAEALRAIETQSLYFAGPFNLKQGGYGVVGRMPIFNDSGYIGMSVAVIDFFKLLKLSGVYPSEYPNVEFMMTKTNPRTGTNEQILALDKFNQSLDLYTTARIPEGDWVIYAKRDKKDLLNSLIPFSIVGFLFSVLSGLFTVFVVRVPVRLRSQVEKQVMEIGKNELLLSMTQRSARIGSWVMDIESQEFQLNKMSREILELGENENLNLNAFITYGIDSETRAQLEYVFRNCMNKGEAFDINIKARIGASNHPYSLRLTGLLYNENGNFSIFGSMQDINEQVKIANERQEILSSIQDAFIACDANWKPVYWNKEAEVLLDFDVHRDKGKHMIEILHAKSELNLSSDILESKEKVQMNSLEFYINDKGLWCEMSLYQTPSGVTALIKNVTERHNYIQRIENQNTLLREITWMQSHVVRAPLAKIQGGIELLKNETDPIKRERLLTIVFESTVELDKIITEIINKSMNA